MNDSATHRPLSEDFDLAKTKHIPALDGVRGIAIILVLFVHLTPDSHVRANRLLEWIYKFLWSGWIGVDLFFVLSGFLITGILLKLRQDHHYFRNFYMRRTLRIFPLYFGVLFVLFGILAHLPAASGLRLADISRHQLWFWLYATNFGMALHPAGTLGFCSTPVINLSHFWSLGVEEHFYLVWPAIVWLCGTRRLKMVCWAFIVGALALRITVVVIHPHWLHPRYATLLTPLRIDGLAAGSLLAVSMGESGKATWFVRNRGKIWLVCAAALVIDIFIRKGLWQGDRFMETFGLSIVVCLASATLVLALCATPTSIAGGAWSHPALRLMGKYSYGIYMYHPFLQALIGSMVSAAMLGKWAHQSEMGDLIFLLLCTTATMAVALLSYHLFEAPLLSLKEYFPTGSSRASRASGALSKSSATSPVVTG